MVGVCSFCGDQPVVVWYEGPDLLVSVTSPEEVRSDEAWLACSICAEMVARDDRAGVALRSAKRGSAGRGNRTNPLRDELLIPFTNDHLDREFWSHRDQESEPP